MPLPANLQSFQDSLSAIIFPRSAKGSLRPSPGSLSSFAGASGASASKATVSSPGRRGTAGIPSSSSSSTRSSAGSTGKGFAVVADEVQQLAESATNATRRISLLVQTIQVDTAEAVSSMENTTAEVVNGAALAQDAGQALLKIENVSTQLSGLIEEIAGEARAQSEYAIRISDLMAGIRQVSLKTSEGTVASANSVIELADLVQDLRKSVSDFKLPEAPTKALEKASG